MADCVCHFARTVRGTGGKKLVVFFYGYVFEFGAIHNGPATAGHYALRRVLDCPDIDVLCSPISYFDRGFGQSAPAMTAAESIALAGKMWLYEDDTRTYLGTGKAPGWQDGVDTLEETNRSFCGHGSVCPAEFRAGGWTDARLVRGSADVGTDGAAESPRRTAVGNRVPLPTRSGRRRGRAEHDPRTTAATS